jgi:transposase-like protein
MDGETEIADRNKLNPRTLSSASVSAPPASASGLRNGFVDRYQKEHPKAVKKLTTDWERMTTFYSLPKDHWVHLRTTNVEESPFSLYDL